MCCKQNHPLKFKKEMTCEGIFCTECNDPICVKKYDSRGIPTQNEGFYYCGDLKMFCKEFYHKSCREKEVINECPLKHELEFVDTTFEVPSYFIQTFKDNYRCKLCEGKFKTIQGYFTCQVEEHAYEFQLCGLCVKRMNQNLRCIKGHRLTMTGKQKDCTKCKKDNNEFTLSCICILPRYCKHCAIGQMSLTI